MYLFSDKVENRVRRTETSTMFYLARFEVLMAMVFQVAVFWVMTLCSDVRYQRLRGPCCLHLQDEVK